MKNFRVKYARPDGGKRTTVVAYGRTSADERAENLRQAGNTDVEIIEVKPGE